MANLMEFINRGGELHVIILVIVVIYWTAIFKFLNILKKDKGIYVICFLVYLFIYLFPYVLLIISDSGPNLRIIDGASFVLGFLIVPTLFIFSVVLLSYLVICYVVQKSKSKLK